MIDFEMFVILAVLFFIIAVSTFMAVMASMRSAQLSRMEEERYGEQAES